VAIDDEDFVILAWSVLINSVAECDGWTDRDTDRCFDDS